MRTIAEATVKPERDLARGRVGFLIWGLPLVAILVAALEGVPSAARGVIWALALSWAGAACITNACRSGRLHCYITGPFFLVLAAASLLHGLGILPLGPHGWLSIGAVFVLGAPVLTVVPERIWGRYANTRQEDCC